MRMMSEPSRYTRVGRESVMGNGAFHDDTSGGVNTILSGNWVSSRGPAAEHNILQHLVGVLEDDNLRDVVLGDLIDCLRVDPGAVGMPTVRPKSLEMTA